MRIKNGFELRKLFQENVLLASGEENIDFSKIISMNESAAFMWRTAEQAGEFTADTLADALMAEYEVDEATARRDATEMLNDWKKEGIIED